MPKDKRYKKFIVFEGCDGSGKTTQKNILIAKLKEAGFSVWSTEEPYNAKMRGLVLEDLKGNDSELNPVTELFIFQADRSQHVNEIKRQLEAGMIVICDRFSASSFAYQGYGRGLLKKKREMMRLADSASRAGLLPGLTILLDQDAEVSLSRKRNQKTLFVDKIEGEEIAFHKKIRKGFLELAKEKFLSPWLIIDASKKETTVAEEIWNKVIWHLKK